MNSPLSSSRKKISLCPGIKENHHIEELIAETLHILQCTVHKGYIRLLSFYNFEKTNLKWYLCLLVWTVVLLQEAADLLHVSPGYDPDPFLLPEPMGFLGMVHIGQEIALPARGSPHRVSPVQVFLADMAPVLRISTAPRNGLRLAPHPLVILGDRFVPQAHFLPVKGKPKEMQLPVGDICLRMDDPAAVYDSLFLEMVILGLARL